MQDLNEFDKDMNDLDQEEDEGTPHFFCKLTFGQFFTLMVLEIITLCFVFYLGARYGNEYLKLDVLTEVKREPVSIVSETPPREVTGTDELSTMAREALGSGSGDLKKRVEEILAREKGPTTPPMGEPPLREGYYEEAARPPVEANDLAAEPEPSVQELSPKGADTTGEVVRVKSAEGSKFSVQVGSYPDVKEASYRVEEWKAKGYPAYMMIVNLGDKGQWFRVRLGAFTDKDEANSYLAEIKSKEGIEDAIVVKNEQ